MSAETTKKKPTFEPTIIYVEIDHYSHHDSETWEFQKYTRQGNHPTWEDLTIGSMGVYKKEEQIYIPISGKTKKDIRYVAVHRDGKWSTAPAVETTSSNLTRIHLLTIDRRLIDKMAYPIDPRMKEIDIDGAVNIYPNESNTGWLFEHCSIEEHHDRILAAEVAMSTLFDELIHDKLTTLLVSFIHEHSTANQIGEAAILEHIELFRDDCKKMTRYREGELYIGQHIQESNDHYIYKMVQEAFKLAKKQWSIHKSAQLNVISEHIAPIEKRLNSRHTFKRRWEIPTVFPDSQTQTSTTPTEESSEE